MKSKAYHGWKSCLPILMLMILMYVIVLTTTPVNTEAATTMFDVSSYWGKAGNYTITTEGSIDLTALSSNAGTLNINVSGSNANVVFISDGRIIQNLSITIKGGAKVVLYNVTIDNSTTTNLPPVNAGDNNENNMLYIWGTNTLTGGRFGSGVNVSHMTNLKIDKVYGFDDSTCILNANGGPGGAGIGGKEHNTAGEITILGGTVNAKGGGGDGYSAAGIGGGAKGHGNNVIIKGGIITATGVCGGAGIGGGGLPNNIIANGNDAGVGGRVTIDGGTVVAYGSATPESGSAGIGGGAFYYWPDGADGATVVINGGTVSAYGYSGGAGIGGACRGGGGNVTINGGIVNATCAGGYGAGIGSGGNSDYAGNVGSITINGGLVKASGSQIDIGCGGLIEQDKLACTYYITGGSINARKVSNTPIVSATDHTLLYYTEVTVPGISSVTKVTYSVDGGTAYHTFVDENGKLYLWLPFKGDGLPTNIKVTTSKGVQNNMTVTVNPLSSRWGKSGYILLEKSTTMDITELAPDAGNLTIIARGSDTTLSLIGKRDATYKNLCIRINNGAKVILNNVSIDNGASRFDVIPVEADSNTGNTLYFSGTNTLSSHSTKPGINVPEGSSIIISKVSNESVSNSILNVYGGEEAAAIGARRFVNSGSITILDGTVKAYGGSYAAGIGGGREGKEGVVYIQGGYVTALRGWGSPYDIGGGYQAKYGGANYLNGGSINVSTIGVEPYSSIAGKQVFFTVIKLPNVTTVTDVKYKVGTTTEFSAATDINGKLYLWLPTEVTEVDIVSPDAYHYTGIVSATTSNVFRMTDSGFAFAPVKTSYYENEKTFQVAASGGKGSGAIVYSSSDATVATVSNSGEVTIKKAGQVTITAKRVADNYYHEISASIPITIIEPTLQSIAITSPASKLEYIVGDSLDITGLQVTGTYSDNSAKFEAVDTANVSGFDSSKPMVGQTLTVTIGGKTATFNITIKEAPKPTPTLQSIAITKPASKLEYIVGYSLDITGLEVTGTYSDNSTKPEAVATGNVSGFDSSKPVVDQVLTVTIGGKTATYKVTIKEAPKPTPTLQSIAITKPASKLEYIVGDSLDITGLEVTGTYSDNSTKSEAVATGNVSGFDSSKPVVGQVLTITIGGKTATYQVTIKEAPKPTPTLQSITITKPASKLEYIVGDSLDITGLEVTGTYSDNSTKSETVATGNVSGFDSSKPAINQVLTVTVAGKTATYQVTIKEAPKPTPTLQSIAITKPASKLEYIVGDSLDITGLEVTGTYSDNSTKSETVATGNVSGFDSSKPVVGQVLTITIGGKTATYQVTIKEAPKPTPILQSIAITKPASKLEYIVGDSLDITGLEVTGTYSDNSTKSEAVTATNVSGFDNSKPMVGQTLTVTIGGKTATYQVTIKQAPKPTPTLQSIAITILASKLEYIVGDSLDIAGLEVTGNYSDNSKKIETLSTANISGFDNSKPVVGQTLTITIDGKIATYQVTIKEAPKPTPTLQSIAITKPANKLEYIVEDSLDITGLEVSGTYSDNSTKSEAVATGNVSGFDSSKPMVGQTLTVTIGGKTATYQITIKEAPKPTPTLQSIAITKPASKLEYIVGDSLDITGLEVTGTYSDNSQKIETINKVDVSGFDSSKPMVGQTLTVTIGGKTATFNITIKEAPKPTPTLQSIAITKPASKLEYIVGDSLDITGLEVTGTYSDTSTKIETVAKEVITGFDNSKPAVDQVLTVTIGGKTTTYKVTIKEAPKPTPTLQSIAITKPSSKLEYIEGDSLDITGLEVTGTYSDNSTKSEAVATGNVSGFDSSKPMVGQTLTVTIGGKTATYQVTIKEAPKPTPTLQSIAITKPASKLEYIVGDSLDITGLEVTGTYSDNSTKTETVTVDNITGFDSSKPVVSQTLTVTVAGKTATFNVTIKEAPKPTPTLQSIAITSPASKLEYIVDDSLDITGLVVTGTYSDNLTKSEAVTTGNVSGFDSSKPMVGQTLTVTIGGKTASYQVTIKEAPKPTPTLQSIAITIPASKLEYIVGDSLDITGLEVTGTYSDNTKKSEAVTTGNVSGFDSSKPMVGQTLTVTIDGKTATYQVTIKVAPKPTPTLQSIAITITASKLEYIVGQSLDITGLVVTGTYSDTSTKIETVNIVDISGFDSSKPVVGQVLTITIGGKTATYQVTIKEAPKPTPTLQSIAITSPASKLEYIVGDSLDITGLVVTGTYSDTSTKIETISAANISGFESSKPVINQVLTITIGGKTATYQVTIKEAPKPTPILQSITITKPASKLEYIIGDSLDITGLEVTGTYSDNSQKIETINKVDISGFDSSKPMVGQTLTITIGGKTATYKVTIKEAPKPTPTLQSIAITSPASKLEYIVGQSLDITGLVVTGTYSDNSTKAETLTTADVTGFDNSKPAVGQTLTVTVGGKTASYQVTIKEAPKPTPTLQSIAITKPASKLEYIVGDSLDISGLEVTGTYSDNLTKSEVVTTGNVSGFDSSKPMVGQTLTVTIGGKTASYQVTIKEAPKPPVSAVISPVTVSYDLNKPGDVYTAITWNDAKTVDYIISDTIKLTTPNAYAVSGSALVIKNEYITSCGLLQGDQAVFNITFDNGNTAALTVNIVDGYVPGNDTALDKLSVNSNTVSGFHPDTYEYYVELPYGTLPGSAAVMIGATPRDSKATISITQAGSLPGNATVAITAEDETTTKLYTIHFLLGAKPNTQPRRRSTVSTNTTVEVPINTKYSLNLGVVFEDADSSDSLSYKVSVNGDTYRATDEMYTYTPGEIGQVTLVFKANDGKTDSNDNYTVTLITDKALIKSYGLTLKAGLGGIITSGNSGKYAAGTAIPITAIAAPGYSFSGWTSANGGSFNNAYNAATIFTMPEGEEVITANFTYNGDNNSPVTGNSNGDNDTSHKDNKGDASLANRKEVKDWKEIGHSLEESTTDSLTVDMKSNTMVPEYIFETLVKEDVTMTFVLEEGIEWIVKSKDLREAAQESSEGTQWKAIDFDISLNTDQIPSTQIDALVNTYQQIGGLTEDDKVTPLQLSISHEGSFGFTATLGINLGSANAGKTANLFYYNPVTKKLELQATGTITEKGQAYFDLAHASDYVILTDNGDFIKAEMKKYVIQPEKKMLYVGGATDKTTRLTISIPESLKNMRVNNDGIQTVTYESSNPKVATVSPAGQVKALKEGKAIISVTVTINGVSTEFKSRLTVKKAYIGLTNNKSSLKKGETYLFHATGYGVNTEKITWYTKEKSIITINKTTGKAVAIKEGTDYVIAKSGNISTAWKVTTD